MSDPDPAVWRLLEQRVTEAHHRADVAGMIDAYTEAADIMEAQGRVDAACFYLTQAFVLALETGADEFVSLDQRLVAHGRN